MLKRLGRPIPVQSGTGLYIPIKHHHEAISTFKLIIQSNRMADYTAVDCQVQRHFIINTYAGQPYPSASVPKAY